MAAAAPSQVEIGTRGTIASLVSQEIEYFRSLELDRKDVASTGEKSDTKQLTPKLKKKASGGGGGGFLPSICSVVEIKETGYRNLRAEGKKLPREG